MNGDLDRVKKRRVVQMSLAYLAGGWVLLQVLAMLSDTYGWAPWVMRSVPVMVATGFVACVIIAWHHGEPGAQRFHMTEVILLALVLTVGGAVTFVVARGAGHVKPAAQSADRKVVRIAVLPFESIGDADTTMTEAISDEIRGKLVTLRDVEVIARASSNAFRGRNSSPADIARSLDVEYLLTGTVRMQNGAAGKPARMRVSPELIQVADRRSAPVTRWQGAIDEDVTDVFEVQTRIARRVAEGMNVALGASDEARFAAKPTENEEAWLKFLQARRAEGTSFQEGSPYVKAVALSQQAVALDPNFALAWRYLASQAGLAQWFADRGNPDGTYYKLSRHAADEAKRLSPNEHGDAAEGSFLLFAKTDYRAARAAFLKALEKAPSDDRAMSGVCAANEFLDDWAAAAESCVNAARLNPLDDNANGRSAVSLAVVGRMKEARQHGDRLREIAAASGLLEGIASAETINLRLRVYDGSVDELRRRAREIAQDDSLTRGVLVNQYNQFGWLLEPEQQKRVLEIAKPGIFPQNVPAVRALAYHRLGDHGAARREAAAARAHLEGLIAVAWPGSPTVPIRRANLAVVYWLEGNNVAARREAERTIRDLPLTRDGINGALAHREAAWVYLEIGDTTRALQVLAGLLARPQVVTKAAIRTDPRFAALRSRPEFVRMTAEN